MLSRATVAVATLALAGVIGQSALAATITVNVVPNDVPDEALPRTVQTAPAGFGPDAWQGPATGKSNFHVRYLADGDWLSTLFPAEAAGMTIADIASISYYTNRPTGTPAGRDWWIQLYTRPGQAGVTDDQAPWYGRRFINNYDDHTAIDAWTQYDTSTMLFRSVDGGPAHAEDSFGALQAAYGDRLVEMISVQTDSGWGGFDGYIDGLEITLASGSVGRVNFTAPVSEPGAFLLLGTALLALRRRRRG